VLEFILGVLNSEYFKNAIDKVPYPELDKGLFFTYIIRGRNTSILVPIPSVL